MDSIVQGESHAIIIGGSLAGLLASRVLAKHFDRVSIVEGDFLPEKPAPRPGIPQSRHLHVLLNRGKIILEEFFPGLEKELVGCIVGGWLTVAHGFLFPTRCTRTLTGPSCPYTAA